MSVSVCVRACVRVCLTVYLGMSNVELLAAVQLQPWEQQQLAGVRSISFKPRL